MAKNSDVTGYPQSIEHERGANSAPLKLGKNAGGKAASYKTPKAQPAAHANQELDTGGFGGDKARAQRAIPVQPGKAGS